MIPTINSFMLLQHVPNAQLIVYSLLEGEHRMRTTLVISARMLLVAIGALILTLPAFAEVQRFPAKFRAQDIQTDGAVIHVRVGGSGPAVVMLHGFGDTGDMWAPLAAKLAGDRTVVVPDLRGMGLSSHPEGGYEKKTQARDVALVLDKLKIDKADLVTHDIIALGVLATIRFHPEVKAGT
jgi:hypothetical protein